MDFFEFVADVFEEVLFDFARDADVDFLAVTGFDDFGLGVVVFEDYAIFPNEFAVDQTVHFDDEAGEHPFGHEFIVVTQDEIIAIIPEIGRLVYGEELGGDVSAGYVGYFVAEFEFHHQMEKFVAHIGILIICPNFSEVGVGEASEVFLNFWGIEDFVGGGGAPFGLEDDVVFENGIVLEVEADSEVVEVFAKLKFVFAAFEAVDVAEF